MSVGPQLRDAPAPWKLKGRTWAFLVSPSGSATSFPAGWSDPIEVDALATGGEFIGGVGVVQIVSYDESPVGPYNELIYVPGRWKYSDGTKAFRITRIYVSTKESTMNGRRNWNTPKHLAKFDIKTNPSDGSVDISVSHPNAASPFFQASVQRVLGLSALSIPTSTSFLGQYFSLMQPPLPVGTDPEEVATEQWAYLTPILKGSASVRKLIPKMNNRIGDGVGFPALIPWTWGFAMDRVEMDFGRATMYDAV
ncbi:hypothetical protein R3P38DRAFT_3176784 [Favolaschia claudopus]|uniref:Acetoacetate decarboxylase n=1 Tax=Favolaschia claudopus TaxID=2862362 RepID=A0AAW0CZ58_9AGAR